MAGEAQTAAGIALELGLEISGWSEGIAKARAELAGLQESARAGTAVRMGVPRGTSETLSKQLTVTPAFAVTSRSVRDMRADINQVFRTHAQQGQAVSVPISIGRTPWGRLRSEISAGIGEVPIKISIGGASMGTARSALQALLSVQSGQSMGRVQSTIESAGASRGISPAQMRLPFRATGGSVYRAAGTPRSMSAAQMDYVGNLRQVASRLQPHHVDFGRRWYPDAKQWINQQADQYGVNRRQAIGLAAAFSAGTAWQSNQTKFIRTLEALGKSQPFPYNLRLDAHRKAKAIYEGSSAESVLGYTPKVGSFHRNLLGNLSAITLDRWAFRSATQGAVSNYGRGPVRDAIDAAFRQVAAENRMKPVAFQAATWLMEREAAKAAAGQAYLPLRGGSYRSNIHELGPRGSAGRSRMTFAPSYEMFGHGGRIHRAGGGPAMHRVSPDRFHAAISSAAQVRKSNGRLVGETVYVYPRDEYENMQTFLSRDEKTGYALKDDGDTVSVFNVGAKGAGRFALRHAIRHGAKKLDAFDEAGRLPDLYGQYGFREVARDPWNPKYAPPGWQGGSPDVVYMRRGRGAPRGVPPGQRALWRSYGPGGRIRVGRGRRSPQLALWQNMLPPEPKVCTYCGTTYNNYAVHQSTEQHERALRGAAPMRRSRLSYAYYEGGRPAWMRANEERSQEEDAAQLLRLSEEAAQNPRHGLTDTSWMSLKRTSPEPEAAPDALMRDWTRLFHGRGRRRAFGGLVNLLRGTTTPSGTILAGREAESQALNREIGIAAGGSPESGGAVRPAMSPWVRRALANDLPVKDLTEDFPYPHRRGGGLAARLAAARAGQRELGLQHTLQPGEWRPREKREARLPRGLRMRFSTEWSDNPNPERFLASQGPISVPTSRRFGSPESDFEQFVNVRSYLQNAPPDASLGREVHRPSLVGYVMGRGSSPVAQAVMSLEELEAQAGKKAGQLIETLHPEYVWTAPGYQHKGIMSALYRGMERFTGLQTAPSSAQTPYGQALWKKPPRERPFGKSFTGRPHSDLYSALEMYGDEALEALEDLRNEGWRKALGMQEWNEGRKWGPDPLLRPRRPRQAPGQLGAFWDRRGQLIPRLRGGRVAPLEGDLPPELGTLPIAPGMVRGYHMTRPGPGDRTPKQNLDEIRRSGLRMANARGEEYAEPNFVWFSGDKRRYGEAYSVEAHIPATRSNQFYGRVSQEELDEANYRRHSNFNTSQDVSPDEIKTWNEPWMYHARYMLDEVSKHGRRPGAVMREVGSTMAEFRKDPSYEDYGKGYDQFVAQMWRARKHRAGGGRTLRGSRAWIESVVERAAAKYPAHLGIEPLPEPWVSPYTGPRASDLLPGQVRVNRDFAKPSMYGFMSGPSFHYPYWSPNVPAGGVSLSKAVSDLLPGARPAIPWTQDEATTKAVAELLSLRRMGRRRARGGWGSVEPISEDWMNNLYRHKEYHKPDWSEALDPEYMTRFRGKSERPGGVSHVYTEPMDPWMYHVTQAENIPSIIEKGVTPRSGYNSMGSLNAGKRRSYWSMYPNAEWGWGNPVALATRLSSIRNPESDEIGELMTSRKVKPESLFFIGADKRIHPLVGGGKRRAGGGDAGLQPYIVGELGRELFVPDRMRDMIPPDVFDQLPKRQEGGPIEIGQGGEQMWVPPEDGWIIPNRLMNRMPHAATGRPVSPGQQGLWWDQYGAPIVNRGRPELAPGQQPAGLLGPGGYGPQNVIALPAVTTRPSGPTIYLPGGQAATPQGRSWGASTLGETRRIAATPVAPEPFSVVTAGQAASPGASRMSRLREQRMEREQDLWNRRLAMAKGERAAAGETFAALQVKPGIDYEQAMADRMRRAQTAALRGLTGRSALGGLFQFGPGGGRARRAAAAEADILGQQLKEIAPKGMALGERVSEAWGKRVEQTSEALTTQNNLLDKAQRGYEHLNKRYGENAVITKTAASTVANLTVAQGKAADAAKHAVAMHTEALDMEQRQQAAIERTQGGAAQFLISTTSAGVAFNVGMKGVQVALDAAESATKPLVDQLTGFSSTSSRVTKTIGEAAQQMGGNVQAAIGQQAGQGGLGTAGYALAQQYLSGPATAKGGAAAAAIASETRRATLGAALGGAPTGLFGGYGGLLGGPIGAELMGGGKGYGEILAGDISAMRQTQTRFSQPQQTMKMTGPLDFIPFIGGQQTTSAQPEKAKIAFDNLTALTSDFADAQERGATAVGQATSGLTLMTRESVAAAKGVSTLSDVDWQKIKDDFVASGQAAGDGGDAQTMANADVVLFGKNTGSAAASVKDYQQAFEQAAQGQMISTPQEYMAQQVRGVQAAREQMAAQAQQQQQVQIPFQLGMQLAQQPLPGGPGNPIGAGMDPRFLARNAGYLNEAQGNEQTLATQGDAGMQAMRNFVRDNVGEAAAEQFDALTKSVTASGTRIATIQTDLANQQARVGMLQYDNQIRILSRTISDAQGMLGQASGPGNLGAVERQQFMLGQQSQQLGIAQSQRELNFQVAMAGFQAPGLSGGEAATRMENAKYVASISQKQLNIQKQQLPLQQQAFTIGAQRTLEDATKEKQIATASYAAQQAAIAAEKDTATVSAKMATDVQNINTLVNQATGVWSTDLSTATGYAAAFGKSLKEGTDALRSALGLVPIDWSGHEGSEMSPTNANPTNTGTGTSTTGTGTTTSTPKSTTSTGGGTTQRPKVAASGVAGVTTGATSVMMGEAGTEAFAILRNPRRAELGGGAGTGAGGGGMTINVTVTGNQISNAMDLDSIGRKLADEIERRLGQKARLLQAHAQ